MSVTPKPLKLILSAAPAHIREYEALAKTRRARRRNAHDTHQPDGRQESL